MKARWKIVLILLAIVFASALAGAAFGVRWAKAQARHRSTPEAWNDSAMHTLEHRLKLTPAQTPRIRAILDASVEDLRAIRTDTSFKSNQVIDRLIAEVQKELAPEQRAELEKLKAERSQSSLEMLNLSPRKSAPPPGKNP